MMTILRGAAAAADVPLQTRQGSGQFMKRKVDAEVVNRPVC